MFSETQRITPDADVPTSRPIRCSLFQSLRARVQFSIFFGDHSMTALHSQPQPGSQPQPADPPTVIIGIDWADRQHVVCLIEPGGRADCRTLDQDAEDTRRHACPKFLRQTFHEFADHARQWSAWSKAFYALKRATGMKHHAAVRALAFKWIRILLQLWKTRTTYSEALYLQHLQQKRSPLLQYLQTP
jgi:hypothetical protein